MLKPHEIFGRMPRQTAVEIFEFLHQNEKPLYRAAVDALAKARKLRPVFVERKPRSEQYAWISEQVARRLHEELAAHVLQVWLVRAHKQLLCDFLDGFGIAHDENGTLETLPPAPQKSEIARVVDSLAAKYDTVLVAIYLNAFQALDQQGWSTLDEFLREDSRFQLAGAV